MSNVLQQHFTDRRDAIVFAAAPALMAPRFGSLEPLAVGRRRYLLAQGGVFVEARSAVLTLRLPVIEASADEPLPFGEVAPDATFAAGPIPSALLARCVARARAEAPCEWAGLIVVDEAGVYQLIEPPVTEATRARVSYSEIGIDTDRLVLDVHSHGDFGPDFSGTDDVSDRSRPGPHLSLVIGRCREYPAFALRGCVGAHLVNLDLAFLGDDAWTAD